VVVKAGKGRGQLNPLGVSVTPDPSVTIMKVPWFGPCGGKLPGLTYESCCQVAARWPWPQLHVPCFAWLASGSSLPGHHRISCGLQRAPLGGPDVG